MALSDPPNVRYTALKTLLEENRSGLLCSVGKNGGGFKDLSSGRNKLCGVMRFLQQKTHAFPHMSKKRYRAMKSEASKKQSRKIKGERSSTKKHGDAFHRNIYHTLFCKDRTTCRCETLFGVATKRSPSKSTTCFQLVKGALEFLQDHKLVAISAEQVIVSREAPVGTRFDCLCHDPSNQETVLVSWKTGYKGVQLPQVADPATMMRSARTSDEISLREHIAQVTCELHMLRDTHHVPVHAVYIVYLSTLGTYRYTRLPGDWAKLDYRKGWDWLLGKYNTQQVKRKKAEEKKKQQQQKVANKKPRKS